MKKKYEDLTFADDFMFCKVMKDEKICSQVVETLLDIKVEHIEYLNSHQDAKQDFRSRGVCFDVYVRDSERVIDLEIQAVNNTNLLKRARYYQAMLDMDQLERSDDYKELQESYVVFICLNDPFDKGIPRYTFKRQCIEVNDDSPMYDDMTTNVFYNASAWSESSNDEIKNFLKYVRTAEASGTLTKAIASAVETAKQHEPWRREFMTLAMKLREEREEGMAIGFAQGEAQQRAKDEAELKAKDEQLKSQAARIAELEAQLAKK